MVNVGGYMANITSRKGNGYDDLRRWHSSDADQRENNMTRVARLERIGRKVTDMEGRRTSYIYSILVVKTNRRTPTSKYDITSKAPSPNRIN